MEKKNKLLLTLGFLVIIYFLTMLFFYFSYSNSINIYNSQTYNGFNTLQNVIHKVHYEDSQLYKTLLSKEILTSKNTQTNFYSTTNHSNGVISDLLDLKGNNIFSSQRIASTIDEYYSLEKLRERIIELHRLNLLNKDNEYDSQILKLINEYENQIDIILIDINKEIEFNKQSNLDLINKLKTNFLIKSITLFIIFLLSLITLFIVSDSYKEFLSKEDGEKEETQILDEDMRRIVSYIKKEVAQGNFPTIKELKFYLKISHPTLIIKLNKLEKSNLIAIKKEGRNKHLFLK